MLDLCRLLGVIDHPHCLSIDAEQEQVAQEEVSSEDAHFLAATYS